ncbi:MAG: acyl-CoA/acyl-ACP dehydrogenase, partial [Chloroflexi bacterium]|nr:acyl-CoA/acyl-ACP dehydrogenase [Chloroflexota bacterium]
EDEVKGYSPEIWKKMADLGWQGMVIPEKYKGQGMTFQDFAVLLEEMGRNILPGPFICTVIEGAYPIMDAGTEEQKKEFLPKIASGELICTMAQLEPNGLFDASGVTLKATHKGDQYVLEGTKVFVEMANVANYILCVARTAKGASAEDGITVFIVDAKSPGIHIEVMPTIGMDKLCEVQFKNVSVPSKNVLGKPDKGWHIVENVMRRGAIAKCAESVGGMQAAVDGWSRKACLAPKKWLWLRRMSMRSTSGSPRRAYCFMAPSAPAGSTTSRSTSEGLSLLTSVTAAPTSTGR